MPIQTRLTVLGPLGGHATGSGSGTDVLITAPADTPLAPVLSSLAAAAGPGSSAPGTVYCEDRQLDPRRSLLGHPPLVDGAVLAFHRPAHAPGPVAAPAARLLVVAGPDAGGVHLLHGGEIRVGRSADADVPLDDPDVSRLHCAVTVAADGSVCVTDLGSTNGTTLDGTPVTGGPVPLPPEALVRLGESVLRVDSDRPVARDPEPAPPQTPDTEQRAGLRGLAGWARRRTGATTAGADPRHDDPRSTSEPAPGTAEARSPWPDPAAVLLTAVEAGPRLWERRGGHPEALSVRIGTAPRASGPLRPVTVGLDTAGSLGLAGPRNRLAGLARSLLAQLAVLHPPEVLELVVLANGRTDDWAWLGWLPHLRPLRGQDCRLLLAFDREQATARINELTDRLTDPRSRPTDGAAARRPERRTVVLVDGDPGSAQLRASVARLAAEGPAAGIHLLCLAETPPATPASPLADTLAAARESSAAFRACGSVALFSGAVATAVRLTGRDGEPGPVATADAVSAAWAERFARALAPLSTERTDPDARPTATVAALPDTCRLLDALALPRVTPGTVRERWARRSGLPLVLGTGPRGPVTVDLTAEAGPVVIEGDPAAGKTELLCSLAASLAVAASPAELTLLLIEGSGEGLRPCAELPHVASHLGARDPVRMRAFAQALREELKRRAGLLGDGEFQERPGGGQPAELVAVPRQGGAGTAHSGVELPPMRAAGSGPLPRLVVLADDVEALLTPPLGAPGRQAAGSVVRALEAVFREGPRLGIHLITTAKPADRSAGLRIVLTGRPAGRAELRRAAGPVLPFQAGRVTGRIPRTATARPTVVPLDWSRTGDPPTRRPVRELGNGPTDVALLASAATRAAQSDQAVTASLV